MDCNVVTVRVRNERGNGMVVTAIVIVTVIVTEIVVVIVSIKQ